MGTWIRHCGWYPGSWVVRLVDRRYTKYDGSLVGERACVDGQVRRLDNDIVDEDRKGLAAWLHKHVRYAQLECERRDSIGRLPERLRELRHGGSSRPLARGILKELVLPVIPAKPAALFLYMYIARLGFLDGMAGLRFCFYHAWFEMSVASLRAEARGGGRVRMSETRTARRAIGDIMSVCRHARPASAARWLTSFAAHLAECRSTRSLVPADRIWARTGARFRAPGGTVISLPAAYTAGAREMYCRNVYLRTGFVMPRTGWVLDLGANRGLFSVWAALAGAQVVAVEAQQGFGPEINRLAAHNGVGDRVHVEIALAGGTVRDGATAGVVADDRRWAATSHGAPQRPASMSVPQLMSAYHIGRIGLLKVDIEGGEFAVFSRDEELRWLDRVDQVVMEVHRRFRRCRRPGRPVPPARLRRRPARQRGN